MLRILVLIAVSAATFAAQASRPTQAPPVGSKPEKSSAGSPNSDLNERSSAPKRKADPKAKAIFEAARKAQCPDGTPAAIKNFEGEFNVTVRDFKKNEKKPEVSQGFIKQYWAERKAKDPKKVESAYRRDLTTNVATEEVTLATEWDGKVAWRWKTVKGKEKPRQLLKGESGQKEKKQLFEEQRRTSELFQVLVLGHLAVRKDSFRLEAEKEKIEFKFGRKRFRFDTDRIGFRDLAGNEFRLWVERKKDGGHGHVVRAAVRFSDRVRWERFDMAQHFATTVGATGKKLFVPCNIIYYDGLRPVLEASTYDPKAAFRFNVMSPGRIAKVFPDTADEEEF